jgi:hypothetical protein
MIAELREVWAFVDSGIDDHSLRISGVYCVDDLFPVSCERILGAPDQSRRLKMWRAHEQTKDWADAGTGAYNDGRFEDRGNML